MIKLIACGMNKKTISYLFSGTKIIIKKANKKEVREGWLILNRNRWQIKEGILSAPFLSKSIQAEQKAIRFIDSQPELGGAKAYQLDKKSYFRALESLPEAFESPVFKEKGAFLNISLGKSDYFRFLESLRGQKLTILEIGADSGWSTRRLAKAGHQVIALDISPHLMLRNYWLKKGIFYEAVLADMNEMPFEDNIFDIVFASASIHHSRNIKKLAKDIYHILKPDGSFIFLREPMGGQKSIFGKRQKELGISENLYTIEEWQEAFQKAGFQSLKIAPSKMDYPRYLESKKDKIIYLLKIIKRYLMIIPQLRNRTVSDYNFSGQKPENEV